MKKPVAALKRRKAPSLFAIFLDKEIPALKKKENTSKSQLTHKDAFRRSVILWNILKTFPETDRETGILAAKVLWNDIKAKSLTEETYGLKVEWLNEVRDKCGNITS
jgi:hypothetical protein